jgi:6-phosphogluconolactonase (cycloisomerase 2 family)
MTMKVRVLLSSVLIVSAMGLASCGGHYTCHTTFGSATCASSGSGGLSSGGGSNNIGVTAFVYFVDPGASQMAMEGLNVANSQTFAPVSSFVSPSVNVGVDFNGMVVVGEKYLYLSSDFPDLYGFSIDSASGALSAVTGSPYAIAGDSIAADPNGRFLFAGDPAGIHVFAINSDGSLTEAPGSPFSNNGIMPTQLVTDGLGRYLYALGGNTITSFSYNQSTGILTMAGAILPGMTMIASEKSGTYILGITGATAAVHVFGIGPTGALAETSNSPSLTTLAPVYLAVDPDGTYIYTFNQTSFGASAPLEPMEGYTLESNGSLTALTGSPFTGLDASIGLFDQSGEFLFSVAQLPNSTIGSEFAYAVDSTTGAVSSNLASAGVAGSYVVTDAP